MPTAIGMMTALAAMQAAAQPASRPSVTLRPALDSTDEEPPRATSRTVRPTRRTGARPSDAPQGFDDPRANELPTFETAPGFGAGSSGFVSTNIRRRSGTAGRGAPRKPGSTSGVTPQAPLSLTAPGTSPTATLLRATASGTSARQSSSSATLTTSAQAASTAATTPAAAAAPRSTLLRIPDGSTTGGIAGTVNTGHLTPAAVALLRRRTAAEEDPFAALGYRVGAFLLLPALDTTAGFDTNPARSPNGRASSFVTVSPELVARSDWQRHEMTATLRGSYTAYDKTPELDRPSVDSKITGRLDVTRDTALIGEGTLVVGTDNPGSPNVQAGLSRFPIYTTLGATTGLQQRFNRLEVTLKGTIERTEYQDSHFTDGTTGTNDDRDYNRLGGTLRTSYDVMPGLKPFVEVGADVRKHDLAVDRYGMQRDSTGWTAKAGSTFEFSRKLTGEAAIGYVERSYKDASLQQLQGFLFDASLIYTLSALTKVKLTATTTAGETTVAGTAGVLTRNAGVEVEHAFRRWLIGTAKFNYGLDDYVGSARKDDRYSISAALTYKLNRWAQVKGEFRQEWLRSSVTGVDYDASVVLLGVRLQP